MYIAKRIIDIFLSLIGIIIFTPLMVIIAIFIKIDSRGPVFYLADRVGKDMKNFKMYKFRTMIDTHVCVGQSVCPKHDPRVTSFGHFLRRTKMNELPQFINVLKGEMTFVGPRPEAPDLAELYPEEAKKVFSVKPGLVGPATILMRNEEELYPAGVDAKKFYIEKILPEKVKIDLEYLKNPNLFKECSFILMAVKETVLGALKKKHIYDNRSQIYLFIADMFLIFCSYFLSVFMLTKNISAGLGLFRFLIMLPVFTFILLTFNIFFGVYTCIIRYISYHEILSVVKGVTSASLFLYMLTWIAGLSYYPSTMITMNWAILILALSALRISLKFYWDKSNPNINTEEKCNIFIYGANETGIAAYNALSSDQTSAFNVVGFIDDEPSKNGKNIHGLKVLGNRHHLKDLAALYKVDQIILTKPNSDPVITAELINACQESGFKFRVFSSKSVIDAISQDFLPFRKLRITDLFPDNKVHMDYHALKNILTDKTVLLNGTGGALGQELCSQILELGCKKLIIIERYECYLAELLASIGNPSTYDSIIPVVADIRKIDILADLFENHQPDIIIHAGTRKYTPIVNINEDNIGEDNYATTFKLARMASKFNSQLFLMISSSEAAQNGSLTTDTLRIAEVCLENFFKETNTRLIIVRMCNIIENRGGVVSNLENQIINQQIVTLPTPDTKTCLMSKYSGTAFILQTLVDANDMSNGKRIFSSEPIVQMSLVELASKLAAFHGLKLQDDIPIIYTSHSKQNVSPPLKELFPIDSIYSSSIRSRKSNIGITQKNIEAIFKNFVISNSNKAIQKDWQAKTQELIKLCGANI